jgi:hypothetical protein
MITSDQLRNLINVLDTTIPLDELVARIANLIILIAGVFAFFYLIYVGILYITAGANPDAAKRAQAGLINIIIGIIVITLSYVLIRAVGATVARIFG